MERVRPWQLDIEVSAECQLRCLGCPINGTGKPANRFMSVDLFKSIIDRAKVEMPDVVVLPWLDGEPLLHPNYYELVKYVDDAGMKYYITTNGMIWNEELFQFVNRPGTGCYQVIFSLDGLPDAKSKSIEVARPGSDRKRILGNIQKFMDIKGTRLAIKMVERGQDFGEQEEFIHHWLSNPKVDYVCLGKMLSNKSTGRIYSCQYMDHNFMVIKYDGRMVSCSYCNAATNDNRHTLGVVDMKTPLLDLFNNEALTKMREEQRNGIFREPCDSCGFPYTGTGFVGETRFRNPIYDIGKIYTHSDYYNTFYSLVDCKNGSSWGVVK